MTRFLITQAENVIGVWALDSVSPRACIGNVNPCVITIVEARDAAEAVLLYADRMLGGKYGEVIPDTMAIVGFECVAASDKSGVVVQVPDCDCDVESSETH